MHWLAHRVEAVSALLERYVLLSEHRRAGKGVSASEEAAARMAFLSAVRDMVAEVSQRPGVLACFAAHEGLLVEAVGEVAADFEALAAMSQLCLAPTRRAAETLSLGSMQQMLLVGSQRKLALIQLGPMTVGVLSPASIQLSEALES